MGKLNSLLKKRAGGSVLFTVVAVMAVLIVFAMTTLTIVNSATRHRNENYAENQAYFTAKSALESTLSCMQNYVGDNSGNVDNTTDYYRFSQTIYELAAMGSTGQSFTGTMEIDGTGEGVSYETVDLLFENIGSQCVKITATAGIGSVAERSLSIVIKADAVASASNFSNAMTTTGGAGGVNIKTYGGSSFMLDNANTIELGNNGSSNGNAVVNGTATIRSGHDISLGVADGNGEHFVVMDPDNPGGVELNFDNNAKVETTGSSSDPYATIYVDGKINFGNSSGTIGTTGKQKINVFCDEFSKGNNSGIDINGNFIVYEEISEATWRTFNDANGTLASIKCDNFYVTQESYNNFMNVVNTTDINGNYVYQYLRSYYTSHLSSFNVIPSGLEESIVSDPTKGFIETPETMLANFSTNGTINPADQAPAGCPTLSELYANGKLVWDSTYGAYVLDTAGGNIEVDLSNTYFLKDSKSDPKGSIPGNNDASILIKGGNKVTFYVNDGATFETNGNGNGGWILTEELYNKINNHNNIDINTGGSDDITSPNVYFNFGAGSTITTGNNCVWSGYVYGPHCTWNIFGRNVNNIKYGDYARSNYNNVALFGASILGTVNAPSNGVSIFYIPDANGSPNPIGANGEWWDFQYYESR